MVLKIHRDTLSFSKQVFSRGSPWQLEGSSASVIMTVSQQDGLSLAVPGFIFCFLFLPFPAVLCQKAPVPTEPSPTSAPHNRPECSRLEHPVVSIQALSPLITSFSHPGVRDYSQLTLDLTRNELIVGARQVHGCKQNEAVLIDLNYLFRLNLNNISLIQSRSASLCQECNGADSKPAHLRNASPGARHVAVDREQQIWLFQPGTG
ncbi:hypothetical protein DNTS_002296 [Danionella cerebrum]|uniref:Uncharacterized protein n=1 Tax=Danionella cerebrum TaxID=2873325 RepID=A0A553Q4K4_9TELE|nr:hypothetical protein DNTS_002296 [Danionella translucida]